jgi:hypothetical protein
VRAEFWLENETYATLERPDIGRISVLKQIRRIVRSVSRILVRKTEKPHSGRRRDLSVETDQA